MSKRPCASVTVSYFVPVGVWTAVMVAPGSDAALRIGDDAGETAGGDGLCRRRGDGQQQRMKRRPERSVRSATA